MKTLNAALMNSSRALLVAALLAACSDGYHSTEPTDNTVSAEDLALMKSGVSLARQGDHQVLRTTGAIAAGVNQFRDLLGAVNPNTAGELPAGRREVNWDGVPAAFTNVDTFPGNFFNVNSPRGVLFSTLGSGLRVSNNGFTDVRTDATGEFNTFSPTRLFAGVGSIVVDVNFVVAGSNVAARVTGFGAVFADVNLSAKTTIQYFSASGQLLLSVSAPVKADSTGLSFVGAVFDSPLVAKVRIISGDASLASTFADVGKTGGKVDLVTLDDFIYGEPHAIAK